mmetsp:Transcript_36322/g.61217  ORF Transcript_36322/g.61217 Transcript_36322/m.61217 type:complete len:483 (+) Transcript_36322:4212-5660(+)
MPRVERDLDGLVRLCLAVDVDHHPVSVHKHAGVLRGKLNVGEHHHGLLLGDRQPVYGHRHEPQARGERRAHRAAKRIVGGQIGVGGVEAPALKRKLKRVLFERGVERAGSHQTAVVGYPHVVLVRRERHRRGVAHHLLPVPVNEVEVVRIRVVDGVGVDLAEVGDVLRGPLPGLVILVRNALRVGELGKLHASLRELHLGGVLHGARSVHGDAELRREPLPVVSVDGTLVGGGLVPLKRPGGESLELVRGIGLRDRTLQPRGLRESDAGDGKLHTAIHWNPTPWLSIGVFEADLAHVRRGPRGPGVRVLHTVREIEERVAIVVEIERIHVSPVVGAGGVAGLVGHVLDALTVRARDLLQFAFVARVHLLLQQMPAGASFRIADGRGRRRLRGRLHGRLGARVIEARVEHAPKGKIVLLATRCLQLLLREVPGHVKHHRGDQTRRQRAIPNRDLINQPLETLRGAVAARGPDPEVAVRAKRRN